MNDFNFQVEENENSSEIEQFLDDAAGNSGKYASASTNAAALDLGSVSNFDNDQKSSNIVEPNEESDFDMSDFGHDHTFTYSTSEVIVRQLFLMIINSV